jgi:hypothetical protein
MMMNVKGFGRMQLCPKLRYYAGIHLEGLRKTTKNTISIASSGAEIQTQDLTNMKQEH